MTGEEISLFDAWSAWADGVDIRQRVLWGLEIYWWARWGKVAALLAGLVLIIDIIGPERIEAYLKERRERKGRAGMELASIVATVLVVGWPTLVLAFAGAMLATHDNLIPGIALFSVAFIMMSMGNWLVPTVERKSTDALMWATTHTRFLRVVRIMSILMLVAGFHFDFLVS
ncbi:hypothetical protein [Nonomuraea solani]|uniref:hypothetical protein n=1 Tax=Nonomuraea solani TaxID=1144553 RepID=UPI0011B02081|nr:hypothetical protein [Nonomuraea solani]